MNELEKYINKYELTGVLESIQVQLDYIQKNALEHKNPFLELGERKFTYQILSSREFASPEELEIKKHIDYVSEILEKIEAT